MGRAAPCDDCRKAERSLDAKVEVALTIRWGDERKEWTGDRQFCSLKCFSEWAAEKAEDHEPVPA